MVGFATDGRGMAKAKKKTPAKKAAAADVAPKFTDEQQQVIDHRNGPMLAGAVAGAGKSTTLVERVAKLVASGVPMHKIGLVAFNKDAAEDLNRKIKKRMNMRGQDVDVASTLHSLAFSIWKSSPAAASFALDKGSSMYGRAIRQGAREAGVDVFEADLVMKLASRIKNDCLLTSAGMGLRALGMTPSTLVDAATDIVRAKKSSPMHPGTVLDLYFAAERVRTNGVDMPNGETYKFVGFDDLLAEGARIMTEDYPLREMWQNRFQFLIVDEAQDLCEAQWRIVNALADGHQNIVIVGDVAQAIYVWRGARPEHFLNFDKTWPLTRKVFMCHNFRSGLEIIRVANVVLDGIPDDEKLPMRLECTRDAAGFVGYRETENPWTEARDIAENILKHRDAGVEWRDQAILVRRNDQSAPLELELLKARVPARIVRGQSFFASREAKTALAYLRLISNRADADDFEAAIMNPPKYLGRVFIDKIVAAWSEGLDWLDVMDAAPITAERKYNSNARDFLAKMRMWRLSHAKGASPLQLFMKICESTNWTKWLEEGGDAVPDNDTAMNFDRVRDFLAGFDDVGKLLDTVTELRAAQRAAAVSRNAVSIATTHAVKGLEWSVVYIAGMVEKIWPVGWSSAVDERRVFYVAVTRARDELWLNGYRYRDDSATEEVGPSPYLKEVGHGEPTDRIGKQTIAAGQMSLMGETI